MPHRAVVHQPEFDAKLFSLHIDRHRCDEFIYGITEVLHRDATVGRRIGNTDVWFLSTPNIPDFLALIVYYTFNDDTVWLIEIDAP